tara:strand:- start:621 stop:758 length:138 start_codon:yes stop_codon:yes gene_type:complete
MRAACHGRAAEAMLLHDGASMNSSHDGGGALAPTAKSSATTQRSI